LRREGLEEERLLREERGLLEEERRLRRMMESAPLPMVGTHATAGSAVAPAP
jgi:hypothetical protein